MSRSIRKTPMIWCAVTRSGEMAKWKRDANRLFRRVARVAINRDREPPEDICEVSDVFDSPGDGKTWVHRENWWPKLFRK